MKIDILIDEITNCLIKRATGKEVKTHYNEVDHVFSKDEAQKLKAEGWKFDWSLPQKQGCKLYELYSDESNEIQGLIAIRHEYRDLYTFVQLVESNPKNIGRSGVYIGCGAHLFAIACYESWKQGFDGYVAMEPKTNLIKHYCEQLGAELIGNGRMVIGSRSSLALVEKYIKEK